jgi:ribokinase
VSLDAVVVGQIARDLVLVVDEVPDAGTSAPVRQRREMLGGKGANQAVGLAQLGVRVALLGVAGQDETGDRLLDQARRDGIDVSSVVRRQESGLIVDVVDGDGRWRYLEYLPEPTLLTEQDVAAARELLRAARYVIVQLQQPRAAARAAARCAREAGRRVVLDGVADRDLLSLADVLRADAREAGLLLDEQIDSPLQAVRAGRRLLREGPGLVALAVEDAGNVFVWADGDLFLPLEDVEVADTTGAGDAFVAALTATLSRDGTFEEAARLAVRAAGMTVRHPGGRPDLRSLRLKKT